MTVTTLIHERLTQAFAPEHLEVIDDSPRHVGHAGSQNGAGHYTVIIMAKQLGQLSRVSAHREIYRVLTDLVPDKIHALQIKIEKLSNG